MIWRKIPRSVTVDVRILSLIAGAAASSFSEAVLQAANSLTSVEEVFAFELLPNHTPRPVGSAGRRADCNTRVEAYTRQFHSLDPVVHELKRHPAPDALLVRRTMASEIHNSRYRWSCYDRTGFAEKISVALPAGDSWAVINFYRSDTNLSESSLTSIVDLSVALFQLLQDRMQLGSATVAMPRTPEERLVTKLANRFPSLTERETRVLALTLLGNAADEIGRTLGIATSTTHTYRQRAYERLGISSANQVLAHILD